MYCASCGAWNRDDAGFCLACRQTIASPGRAAGAESAGGWATPFYDRDVSARTVVFAGFWDRALALVMDTAISFGIGAVPGLLLLFVLRGSGIAIAIMLVGWVAGGFIYQLVAVAYGGGFGMRSVGIRIVRVEDGSRPGLARSALRLAARTAFGILPFLGSVLGPADALWMIKDGHKQTWHDKVARTYVIET